MGRERSVDEVSDDHFLLVEAIVVDCGTRLGVVHHILVAGVDLHCFMLQDALREVVHSISRSLLEVNGFVVVH